MNTSASNRRLRVLLTAITKQALIPKPEFQRRLVWSNKDKVEFIRTVLEGYPFPEIYIAAGNVDPKTGEGTEMLVDGQQRITTLHQYFKDSPDLKLPKDIPAYSTLSEPVQIAFLEYEVVVRDLGNKPIDEIKAIFQRINSTSYGLNAMEIDNARYGGEFKTFAEKISEHEFFSENNIFNSTDIKRMNDVRFCLGLICSLITGYFNRDKEIETLLDKYNESFPEKDIYLNNINETLNTISSLNFPKTSRAFKKADFFTLFIEIYKVQFLQGGGMDISSTRINLDNFYYDVDNVSVGNLGSQDAEIYYKSSLQASNDRNNRISRGKIIQSLLVAK
jgi:hypothetical protein